MTIKQEQTKLLFLMLLEKNKEPLVKKAEKFYMKKKNKVE